MRLTERVYLVGSGKYGSGLSHDMDCNVFLIDGGGEFAMIDAGSGVDPERIVACIEAEGIEMNQIKQLLLTHAHADHAAGAHYYHKQYGIEVLSSWEAAPWLEQGDMDKTSLNVAKRAGVYPQDFSFPVCPISRTLRENDTIQIGNLHLQVLETPGHSRGHLCFLLDEPNSSSLFSGDVLFACGKIFIQNVWDCNIQDYAASIAKLNHLSINRLFPGHGACMLSQGQDHIEMAKRYFDRLELPPNL